MKLKIKNKLRKGRNNKGYITFVLLGIALFGFLMATGFINNVNPPPDGTIYIPATPTTYGGYKSLELHTLTFITPPYPPESSDTPPPITGTYCPRESQKTPNCQCVPTEIPRLICILPSNACSTSYKCPDTGNLICGQTIHPAPSCVYNSVKNPSGYALHLHDSNCTEWCIGKPVIYLYPKMPLFVDVSLSIPGSITESIPSYPSSGWNHILAYPDSTLFYQEKMYHELYYESAIKHVIPPENGIIIPRDNLLPVLTNLTSKLGLLPNEQKEFLDYWMPKLEALDKPFILFSILSPQEKDRVDHVTISPSPETKIEFLAYFKGITAPVVIPSLHFPSPPKRIGFTSVEWGGVIDPQSN